MPPENVLTSWSAASAEVEPLEQLVGPGPGPGLGQVVQPADHLEVGAGAHQPVDGGLLGGHADAAPHRAGVGGRRRSRRPWPSPRWATTGW